MLQNFRSLCLLCSFSAFLILAGFFLKTIPVILQVLLLLFGVITSCISLFGIIKYFIIQKTEIK
jgi:hypothetical protein